MARRIESTPTLQKDNFSEGAFGPFFLSLDEIVPALLAQDMSESELVELIQEISQKFTIQRNQIEDYVNEERRVSAYASFYMPTNMPKLFFLLNKLSSEIKSDLFKRPFIDYGCGPGTFSLALSSIAPNANRIYHCIDSSKLMLKQAQSLFNHLRPKVHVQYSSRYIETNKESVLFFGHSINELGSKKMEDLVATIQPAYVIYIEPGTSELFNDIKRIRESLLGSYDILYPCPSSNNCPSSWCHQVLRMTHDSSIERLSQMVGLDRKVQPLVAHLYIRKDLNNNLKLNSELNHENDFIDGTIIRYLTETKFSFEYEVCYLKDGKNSNQRIEIMKKELSKAQEKFFKNSDVGEKIQFKLMKEIDKKWRVSLNLEMLGDK